jgi:hypothetical protein
MKSVFAENYSLFAQTKRMMMSREEGGRNSEKAPSSIQKLPPSPPFYLFKTLQLINPPTVAK